jgi:hypothetical protein
VTAETQAFDLWAAALSEERRRRLSKHIAVARSGPAWMREWLLGLDAQLAANPSVTHLPAAEDLHLFAPDDGDEATTVPLGDAELQRWVETGEWPESPS